MKEGHSKCILCGRTQTGRTGCKWCWKGGTGDPPAPEMPAWKTWQRGMISTLRARLLVAGFDYVDASNVCCAVFYDHGSVVPRAMPYAAPYLDRVTSVGRYEDMRHQAMLGRTIRVKLHEADPSAAHDEAKILRIDVISLLVADVITRLRRSGVSAGKRDAIEIFGLCVRALETERIRRKYEWIWALSRKIVEDEVGRQNARMRVVGIPQADVTQDGIEAEREADAIAEAVNEHVTRQATLWSTQ